MERMDYRSAEKCAIRTLLFDTVLVELAVKRTSADAKDISRSLTIVLRNSECSYDHFPLNLA